MHQWPLTNLPYHQHEASGQVKGNRPPDLALLTSICHALTKAWNQVWSLTGKPEDVAAVRHAWLLTHLGERAALDMRTWVEPDGGVCTWAEAPTDPPALAAGAGLPAMPAPSKGRPWKPGEGALGASVRARFASLHSRT